MDHTDFLKIVEKRVRTAIKNRDALGKCGAVPTVPLRSPFIFSTSINKTHQRCFHKSVKCSLMNFPSNSIFTKYLTAHWNLKVNTGRAFTPLWRCEKYLAAVCWVQLLNTWAFVWTEQWPAAECSWLQQIFWFLQKCLIKFEHLLCSCVMLCCKHAGYQRQNQLQSHITPVLSEWCQTDKSNRCIADDKSWRSVFFWHVYEKSRFYYCHGRGKDLIMHALRPGCFFPLPAVCPEYEMMQWGSHN